MIKAQDMMPELTFDLVGGGRFDLNASRPDNFTMIVVYRGLHCPICADYLKDLDQKSADFADLGIDVVVVSSDDAARAQQAKLDWGINNIAMGYGLSIEKGREIGLYISNAISAKEPEQFVEPGLYMIRPDNSLYFASIQTMPFARPAFSDILNAAKFVIAKGYPARGEA